MGKKVRGAIEEGLRPSEVFATRLREVRKGRPLTQAELAQKMTNAGRPLSKAALLRIEKGKGFDEGGRGLLLDEALALAFSLNAAPAYLLSPPEGNLIALTDHFAMDGNGVRDWLTLGLVGFEPAPETQGRDRLDVEVQRRLTQLAIALTDAARTNDQAGITAAARAIIDAVRRYQEATDSP
jgi:transcriptional regulator with XRE-family HTH domain